MIAAWATDDAIATLTGVVGDDRVHIVQVTPDVDASTFASGAVTTDGAVDESQRAPDIDPTGGSDGPIATDGAIGEHCRTIAANMHAAAMTHISERISVLGFVVANGAIDERQRTPLTLDTTTGAAGVTGGSNSIGDVVADCAVDERQRPPAADATSRIRGVVTDDTVVECQRAEIHDAAAALFLSTWPAVPNRHLFKDYGSAFLDEKDPFRSLLRCLVGLYLGGVSSQPTDGDVFADDDACFGVDGVGDLDDSAAGGIWIIDGSLDGGKVAAGSAHGIG